MQQLIATVLSDDVQPYPGLVKQCRVSMAINNKDEIALDVVAVVGRVYVDFSGTSGGLGWYLGDLTLERLPSSISPGDSNSISFLFRISDEMLALVEERRGNHDVALNFEVSISGIPRPKGAGANVLGTTMVNTMLADSRSTSRSYVTARIAKSRWLELLDGLQYLKPQQPTEAEIRRLVAEATEAKRQAEEAARGAREAATLTAVTNLADAYLQEARALKTRSRLWFCISVAITGVGGYLMVLFTRESVRGELAVAAAVIRAVILAAIFGLLTLCLRVYESYLHLEVVNRHRVNIGRTFEAFKAAQPTERAREIMAAITAEHMLAFGKSGFAPKDTPNQGAFPALTELLRSITERQ